MRSNKTACLHPPTEDTYNAVRTWSEVLSEKIPKGDECRGCEFYESGIASDGHCVLFSEPSNGKKIPLCKHNKWLHN